MALLSGEVETDLTVLPTLVDGAGSGWLCYPGKLKLIALGVLLVAGILVPDGFAIRGS